MIEGLRIAMMASWALPMGLYARAVVRLMVGKKRDNDTLRAAVWFAAAVFFGFGLKWLIYPYPLVVMPFEEELYWAGLYLLAAIVGQWLTWEVYGRA